MNKVILVGRLGQTPELKTVGENQVANFTLATSEKYKGETKTDWHNVEAWGKTAELMGQYLEKGREVLLEGKMKTDSWEKDGVKKSRTKVVVNNFEFIGKKETSNVAPTQTEVPF